MTALPYFDFADDSLCGEPVMAWPNGGYRYVTHCDMEKGHEGECFNTEFEREELRGELRAERD